MREGTEDDFGVRGTMGLTLLKVSAERINTIIGALGVMAYISRVLCDPTRTIEKACLHITAA